MENSRQVSVSTRSKKCRKFQRHISRAMKWLGRWMVRILNWVLIRVILILVLIYLILRELNKLIKSIKHWFDDPD